MNILTELNEQQREAVLSEAKRICVIAGPGCGKTKTLVSRVVNLVSQRSFNPRSILLLTFSKKAIKEIRNRLEHLLGVSNASRLNVHNFHSYCYRFLRENYRELGFQENNFPIYDKNDQETLLKGLLDDLNYPYDSKELNTIISLISLCKIKTNQLEYVRENDPIRYSIIQKYQQRLSFNKALDFNDLLTATIKLLKVNEQLRKVYQSKFSNILVDEFQDVNDVQWELVNLFAGKQTTIFLVGDPNQSIYGFQGSSPELISSFIGKEDWTSIYLNINYRSTANIIEYSNQFLTRNKQDLIFNKLRSTKETGATVEFISSSVRFVIKKIVYLIENLRVKQGEIVILYRNNYLSSMIEQELTFNRISYEILGAFKFIEREEVKDVVTYLKMMSFQDDISFLRILKITESFGAKFIENVAHFSQISGLTIANYLTSNVNELVSDRGDWKLNKNQKKVIGEFINSFKQLAVQLETDCVVSKFATEIISGFQYFAHLEKKSNHAERKRNIQQLLNVIRTWEKNNHNFENLRAALNDFIQYCLITFEDSSMKSLKNNLILSSVHQAKGLEFDFVFFLHLDNGILPYKNSADLAEEKRIFYVGITRARKRLYLVSNNANPSDFLNLDRD